MVDSTRNDHARWLRTLAIGLGLTLVFFGVCSASAWWLYLGFREVATTELAIARLTGTIVHLDEVLTMSARMGAATGDPKWQKRYDSYVDDLDAAIKQTVSLAPEETSAASGKETDIANLKLVDMETRAFELIRAGQKEAAAGVLFSDEYEKQKAVYAAGMKATNTALDARVDRKLASFGTSARIVGIGSLVMLAFLIVVWVQLFRFVKRAVAEIKEAEATAARNEKLAAVGQLAASVGHELRNPLATIRNAATFISRKLLQPQPGAPPVDDRVQEFLDIIDREVDGCTKIISDLLDFARERKPNRGPCPLRALVDEAITLVPAAGTRIVNSVSDDIPIPQLDRDMFRQVMINLIQNGAEAAQGAAGGGEVIIEADGGGAKAWVVRVTDNGPGIAPGMSEKVFEPLFTTKAKGTGLGLSIVARLVRTHGGAVRLDAGTRGGTTAVVELPSERANPGVAS